MWPRGGTRLAWRQLQIVFCCAFNVTGQMHGRDRAFTAHVHLEGGWPWNQPFRERHFTFILRMDSMTS